MVDDRRGSMHPGVPAPCESLFPEAVCSMLRAHKTVCKNQRTFFSVRKNLKVSDAMFLNTDHTVNK